MILALKILAMWSLISLAAGLVIGPVLAELQREPVRRRRYRS